MRIAVFGAGCVGCVIGCALHDNREDVTFFDTPERVRNLLEHGIGLRDPDGAARRYPNLDIAVPGSASGSYDVVMIAVKAHQFGGALDDIVRLVDDDTILVTTQNGIPWWYLEHSGGAFESRHIEASDPGGRIGSVIDSRRVVGCVVYPAISMLQNGDIARTDGNRFPVGAVAAESKPAAEVISKLFTSAGFKSPVLDDLRGEIWLKAVGNGSLNPISALTRATLVEICEHADTHRLLRNMMLEAEEVAESLGVTLRVSIDRRLEGARRVGAHRSSMLQDVDNGVAMEVEALVGSISELGRMTGVATPNIDTVLALARLLNQTVTSGNASRSNSGK